MADHRLELEANDIRNLGQLVSGSKVGDFLVTQPGSTVLDVADFLERHMDKPKRRKGTKMFAIEESFNEYVNEFKNEHSAIYLKRVFGLNAVGAAFECVLNGNPNGGDMNNAAFEDFKAQYQVPIGD